MGESKIRGVLMRHKRNPNPPGRIKIMKSLSELMAKKDFHSITTSEIAGNANVTEGLIYKYFSDKKDLLYQVLKEHFELFQNKLEVRINTTKSCVSKIDIIIFTSLESYAANRVFSKILYYCIKYFHYSSFYPMARKSH